MGIEILDSVFKELGSIIGFAGAGAVGYLAPLASKKIKTYLQQRWFNASLKRSMELKVKIAELKGKIGAQRIYLLQFHNGKVYLGDNQFHKYSVSALFEITSGGLSREMQNMQNVPLSSYAELIYRMQKENTDIVIVGDHRGCDMTFEDADLDEVKYSTNPSTILYVKIKNKNDVFVGLLALYFDKEITRTKLLDDLKHMDHLDSILVYIKNKI